MPQMYPLNWMSLFIFFVLIFLFFNIIMFYNNILLNLNKKSMYKNFMDNKTTTWKW